MNPEDIPKLRAALQDLFPEVEITVEVRARGHRLSISADNCKEGSERALHRLLTPEGMDYTALSWQEWLHRATTTFRARLT